MRGPALQRRAGHGRARQRCAGRHHGGEAAAHHAARGRLAAAAAARAAGLPLLERGLSVGADGRRSGLRVRDRGAGRHLPAHVGPQHDLRRDCPGRVRPVAGGPAGAVRPGGAERARARRGGRGRRRPLPQYHVPGAAVLRRRARRARGPRRRGKGAGPGRGQGPRRYRLRRHVVRHRRRANRCENQRRRRDAVH